LILQIAKDNCPGKDKPAWHAGLISKSSSILFSSFGLKLFLLYPLNTERTFFNNASFSYCDIGFKTIFPRSDAALKSNTLLAVYLNQLIF